MGHQPVIQFEHVSKQFVLEANQSQSTLLESLIDVISRRPQRPSAEKELWAVRDVSFDVMPGESVGIIGRNGSGKSTMLKLIARILRPSHGRITVRGRVSALLELGAGFHPDLSGRENIYLNSAVLGLQKEEVDRYFRSIVNFSELEEFIDMPVKHYSSGMYMRLGFSVAIHVKPDILIVDEILAVGDQAFQTKCLDRIYRLKKQGTTIIMVSHDMGTLQSLCSHLIWIEHGRLKMAGPAKDVAEKYLESAYEQSDKKQHTAVPNSSDNHEQAENQEASFERWGSREIEITGVRLLDGTGEERSTFKTNDKLIIEVAYLAHRPMEEPEFGLAIHRQDGVHINGPNNRVAGVPVGVVHGPGMIRYCVDHLPLLPGHYKVTAAIHDYPLTTTFDYHKEAYPFHVLPGGSPEIYGLVEFPARWELERVNSKQ